MIIIITGASHTGKTVLAQRMLEEYKYPYVSIDHLKMGLIRSGNTDLTPEDDDDLVGYLWPIVREMIKTAIENRQNLIVEGCYIPYDWRKDFDNGYLSEIRFICLAMTDAYIGTHFEDITDHGSDIENRLDDSYCNAEWIKEENRKAIEGFKNAGEPIVLIDDDYEKTMTGIIEYVNTSQVTKARKMEIKTSRLTLRPIQIGDEAEIHEYAGDKDITMMFFLPNDTYEETCEFVRKNAAEWESVGQTDFEFVILYDGKIIGGCDADLSHSEDRSYATLGWIINKEYRKRGFASEAAAALLDFAFESLGIEKVYAQCDIENPASYKVMMNIGMTCVNDKGTRTYPRTGNTSGEYTCMITKEEWRQKLLRE